MPTIDDTVLTCERQVLFENRGDTIPRIPSLVATPRGTLLATAQWRKGGRGDHGHESDIVQRRSTDGGRSWEAVRTLASEPGCDFHVGPSVVDRRSGRICTFYRRWPDSIRSNQGFQRAMIEDRARWREWGVATLLITSDDDGVTWSAPREVEIDHPDNIGFISIGNGIHGVQLADGRLAVQASCPTADDGGRSMLLLSDDGGECWTPGPSWDAGGYGRQEFALAAFGDRIHVNQRHLGATRRSRWLDLATGETGTFRDEPQLTEPVCHASLLRVEHDGREALLFANPSHPSTTGGYDPESRRELGLRVSTDRGEHWSAPVLLEPGRSGYCDLVQTADGSVCCLYEAGVERYDDELRLVRVPLAALLGD